MILKFQNSTGAALTNSDLVRRFLNGAAADQVFAEEVTSGGSSVQTRWLLADNEGTIRDVATYAAGATTVQDHLVYDSFGNYTESNSAYTPTFTYTGQMYDADAQAYHCGVRWYDPKTGQFLSHDPLGFAAGDPNLYRYCGNGPTNFTDPSGMYESGGSGGSGGGWSGQSNPTHTHGAQGGSTYTTTAPPPSSSTMRDMREEHPIWLDRMEWNGDTFVWQRLPDGLWTWLPIGARIVGEQDGSYHIEYPNGNVSNVGQPNTTLQNGNTWGGYITHPSRMDKGYRIAFYVSVSVAVTAGVAAGGVALAGGATATAAAGGGTTVVSTAGGATAAAATGGGTTVVSTTAAAGGGAGAAATGAVTRQLVFETLESIDLINPAYPFDWPMLFPHL